jgi:peptidyl-prolyl cis-trans isomerase D
MRGFYGTQQAFPEGHHTVMLRFLSQRTGMKKFVLWAFIGVLVLGLGVVFAVPSNVPVLGSFAPLGSSTVVASVDGYPVTLSELRNQIKVFSRNAQSMQSAMPPSQDPDVEFLYPQYGKTAIETLVNARLVRREADRFNLGATKEEMQERITTMFIGPDGKWIGTPAYQVRLRQMGLTVEAFERDVADGIVEAKLRNLLTAGVMVSDRDIEDDYRRTNTTMTPTYVLVPVRPDTVPAPTDEELRAFFDQNRERFRITQPQRKITYLFVDQEAVSRTLQISDEELRGEFDPANFVSAVRVAQVVLNVSSPDQEAAVRQRADEIANRIRGGEDFAEVARATSEDAATKAQGGDAGFVERASIAKGDPRERLFTMEVNQTSAPIKVGNTYVVYKVLERRERTFEEAREELLATARSRRGYGRGIEVAQQAEQKLRETKDPQRVANEMNASLDTPAVTVRETPYVQPGDAVPEIGSNPQFQEETTKLENVGDVGTVVGITNGFAVPMLADKREPHDASFEEVRDRVAAVWREDRAKQATRDSARQLAASATPEALMAAARAQGLAPKTQPNWKAGMALPERTASDLIDNALLGLAANTVAKEPLEMPDGFLVLGQGERKEPDMGEPFNQQRDSIRERLLSTKRNQVFSAYMMGLRKKLEESGDIVIYQETIDRAFEIETDLPIDDDVPTSPPVGLPSPGAALPVRW